MNALELLTRWPNDWVPGWVETMTAVAPRAPQPGRAMAADGFVGRPVVLAHASPSRGCPDHPTNHLALLGATSQGVR